MSVKKRVAVAVCVLIVSSAGAFAADTHQCQKGTHWDAKKSMCVKEVSNK